MDTKTKYLKIACNLATALVILWFIIFILPRLMSYFMPFVVGLILAVIANPIVKFLEKHIKINKCRSIYRAYNIWSSDIAWTGYWGIYELYADNDYKCRT